MTLSVAWRLPPDRGEARAEAAAGTWTVAEDPDPDGVLAALAGSRPGEVRVTAGGQVLEGARALRLGRVAVAGCRLEPIPTLRVADVVLLGLRAPRPSLLHTLVGTRRARTMSDDDEAQVRALAGRTGLAAWVDRPAADLPPDVAALTDVTRALAGLPRGLILRRPDWLQAAAADQIREVVRAEQHIHGFAVVELAPRPPDTLPPP
jgi:ABC-type branched-subunit amino acid transport system ATPase component